MDPAILFFFEKDPAALLLYEAFERAVRELRAIMRAEHCRPDERIALINQ